MRKLPLKLKQLKILSRRTLLGETEEKEKEKLARGFEGELLFDRLLDESVRALDVFHLKDYRFKIDAGTEYLKVAGGLGEVQIDNVLVAGDRLYTFEVKNFGFDLVYGSKSWFFTGGREYKDLSMQVNRQRTSLDSLIREGGFKSEITPHLVFVNPRQTIYNMPNLENLMIPSNTHRRLAAICTSNHYDHSTLIDYLDSRRLVRSIYDLPANVSFGELRPGVFCYRCDSVAELVRVNRHLYHCKFCKTAYKTLNIVECLIDELRTLNDTWVITPAMISTLSGGAVSKAVVNKYRRENKISF
ncbi:Nuclease-related domain protein [Jeotgalicoccus saudimassiliensis]|uniref:Nuclease-related domain protein n=1 Tax=Jeotgalicoccus saudimassiliensis TaxID=1461582 RepID=A0A078LYI7_9STAP|nr:nuclease-related domain-containing protein [Jeotgalicoccus saudimassiliensis]CDZ99094.1 Nuclease-related domain protein [Jeotgalicoccus saudimassiliensis]